MAETNFVDIEEYSARKGYFLWLWEPLSNPTLLRITREEIERLSLLEKEILFYVPEKPYDVSDDTSSVTKIEDIYEVRLHPSQIKTVYEACKTIRHELAHVAFGDCDRFRKVPGKLGIFLTKAYYVFIGELRAARYGKN
ncbi:hypothetical protein HYS31_03115 [Candidatus Woesearchaeota archaeon]|nr:hypothetical protein [Candidatus Woesearchaeota archaeon]